MEKRISAAYPFNPKESAAGKAAQPGFARICVTAAGCKPAIRKKGFPALHGWPML